MIYLSAYALLMKRDGCPPSVETMLEFCEDNRITIKDHEKLQRFMNKRASGDMDAILSSDVKVFSMKKGGEITQLRVVLDQDTEEKPVEEFPAALFDDEDGY